MGFTAGYVGSKGTHLDHAYDYNEPAPTASFTQALRKYPMYASINVRSPGASSIYHAMQLSVEKRFSHGLSFLSSYTFSKSIDDASLWNGSVVTVTNFRLERGLSTFDTRHRFITSYTYDLPYGHGRPFGGHSSPVVNAILGGWQTNGIVTMQSGNPLDPSSGLQLSGTQTGTRPDVTCNPNNFPHDPAQWFNTSCFSNNFIGRYGSAGRDIIIGPPTHGFDAAMLKRFPLGKEERYLQFRAEIFNTFNHPNFDNPERHRHQFDLREDHVGRRAGRARQFAADPVRPAAGILTYAAFCPHTPVADCRRHRRGSPFLARCVAGTNQTRRVAPVIPGGGEPPSRKCARRWSRRPRHLARTGDAVSGPHRDVRRQAALRHHRQPARSGTKPTSAIANARRGMIRGPLHGIPIALKDNVLTHDIVTTGGALAFDGYVPPYDATLVKNLRDAGAIIIAKTGLDGTRQLGGRRAHADARQLQRGARLRLQSLRSRAAIRATRLPMDAPRWHRRLEFRRGTAASFWAGNVGSETSGSILSPSNQNMLAGDQAHRRPHQPLRRDPHHRRPGHRGSHGPNRHRRRHHAGRARKRRARSQRSRHQNLHARRPAAITRGSSKPTA